MNNFKKGDVAIVCNATSRPQYNGTEVTLLTDFQDFKLRDGEILFSARVDIDDGSGDSFYAQPHQLKPLPPKDTVSSWDQCVWQPDEVLAHE